MTVFLIRNSGAIGTLWRYFSTCLRCTKHKTMNWSAYSVVLSVEKSTAQFNNLYSFMKYDEMILVWVILLPWQMRVWVGKKSALAFRILVFHLSSSIFVKTKAGPQSFMLNKEQLNFLRLSRLIHFRAMINRVSSCLNRLRFVFFGFSPVPGHSFTLNIIIPLRNTTKRSVWWVMYCTHVQ